MQEFRSPPRPSRSSAGRTISAGFRCSARRRATMFDILIEFEPGHVPGLAFFTMEEELSRLIGRKVDLSTPGFLSRYFRDAVMRQAMPVYDAA
jgi:hypothetical protein